MKNRILPAIALLFLSILSMKGGGNLVVADSISHLPLPSASVFDHNGNIIGLTDNNGRLPYLSRPDFPVTLRYLGFNEKTIHGVESDTIFLSELSTELNEIFVESRQHKVMHVLGYVREYSTLSTYTDTVFLFREKMVDYMLTPDRKARFKGWINPRILASRSYYRFTNAAGLDSVSSKCNHHFSWSDWIGIVPSPQIPDRIRNVENGSDTVRGKYSPTEIWNRKADRINVAVDVLADTTSRKWVPNLSAFFRKQLDFENFRVHFNYDNVVGDSIFETDITGYSFNIESNGRGHNMFRFNRHDEPFFVSTFAEVHILDKEYITVKEARKWEKRKFENENLEIIEPADAPRLQPHVQQLIARVDSIDHESVRLDFIPDHRLMSTPARPQHLGQRAFFMLKQATGIEAYKFHKHINSDWRDFRKEQMQKNKGRAEE